MISDTYEWVVVYKVSKDANWAVRRDCIGEGHASDLADIFLTRDKALYAFPVRATFHLEFEEPVEAPPQDTDKPKAKNSKKAKNA